MQVRQILYLYANNINFLKIEGLTIGYSHSLSGADSTADSFVNGANWKRRRAPSYLMAIHFRWFPFHRATKYVV